MRKFRCLEHRQVVITTTGGTTYRGSVLNGGHHALELTQVEMLKDDGDVVEMQGHCVVPHDIIVEPIQVPGGIV